MRRLTILPLLLVSTTIAGLLVGLSGCGGDPSGEQFDLPHVVIVFQENRTPDNLFQDPVLKARGADIANSGRDSQLQWVPLQKIDLASSFDLDHSHAAFQVMYANGEMNGADRIPAVCPTGPVHCYPPRPQFSYVDPEQVRPYFQLAEQYTFADRMFQTNQGPSFPAHQFIISGTSAPAPRSQLFASGNPFSQDSSQASSLSLRAGCIAPLDELVSVLGPTGEVVQYMYPCFEHKTLIDLLEAKGISWRYYAPSAGSIWTGPNAIHHICQPQSKDGTVSCTGSLWSKVTMPQTRILTDIAKHQLPQVSWVIPEGRASDHAGDKAGGSGPSWVAAIVNAIGGSPYWRNTTIFVTWDDWGGWYDHVAPPIINSYEYGFRVPLIVVSPYAKKGYISHVQHDFGSILKFIEKQYNLPSLNYADFLADDLSDCFDYRRQATKFKKISAPLSPEHFLNDPRPPTNPDDD